MQIYVSSSIAFQTVQEIFKLSFAALYFTFFFIFTIFDRNAVQISRAYTSIAELYFTLRGEGDRTRIRKSLALEQNNPNRAFLRDGAIHQSEAWALNDISSNYQAHNYYQPPQQAHNRAALALSKKSVLSVYLFSTILFCLYYAGYPLKIALGEISSPKVLPSLLTFAQDHNTYYSNYSVYNDAIGAPYPINNNYVNLDLYDTWIAQKNPQLNLTENLIHLDIMGTTTYTAQIQNSTVTANMTCSIRDQLEYLAIDTGPSHATFLQNFPILPSVHCSYFTAANTSYATAVTFQVHNSNGSVSTFDPSIGRMPYVGSNFSLFILSNTDNGALKMAATTVFVDSHVSNETELGPPGSSNDFAKLFVQNVETFGYDGSSEFVGNIDSNTLSYYYYHFTNYTKYLETAFNYYYNNMSYIMTFTVQDVEQSKADPRYIYAAKNMIIVQTAQDFNTTSSNIYFMKTYYRTLYDEYVSSGPSSVSPQTTLKFGTGVNITFPMQVFPMMFNVKVAPTVYALLSKYAPHDYFDIYGIAFETAGGLRWEVTIQIYTIAILFGLAIITGVIYFCSIQASIFHSVPSYYDLLHAYHQKGKDSAASLFRILEPSYVGKGYVAERDANHVGVLDEVAAHMKPKYDKPYRGKVYKEKEE